MKTAKNTVYQLLGRILGVATSILVVVLLARMWGPASLGQYTTVTVIVGFFGFLAGQGINMLVVRETARNPEQIGVQFGNLLGLSLVLAVITLAVLYLFSRFFLNETEFIQVILLGGIWMILGIWISMFSGVFYAFEHMEYEFIVQMLQYSVTLVLVPIVIYYDYRLSNLFLALIAGRFIGLIACFIFYKYKIHKELRLYWHYTVWRDLLRKTLPFSINALLILVYIQIDVLLIGRLHGEEDVGFYRAASSLVLQLPILIIAVNNSLLPRMSRYFKTNMLALKHTTGESVQYAAALAFPMFFGLFLLADQIVNLFYTSQFEPSIIVLQILAIMIPLRYINNSLATTLTASDRQSQRTLAVFIGAAVNVIMNLWLISYWSYVGAGVATVITDFVICIFLLRLGAKALLPDSLLSLLWRPFLAGLFMGIYLMLVRFLPIWILIPSAAFVYGGILYSLGGIYRDQFNVISSRLVGQARLRLSN